MTNEKLLAKLHEFLNAKNEVTRYEIITNLIATAEDEIRTETAKSRGQGNIMKTAKDILKVSEKGDKGSLKFAYTAPNGFQYVCDGFRLLKLHNPLPLPELPATIIPVRYENIIPHPTNTVDLALPDPDKLRAYIKIKKAEKQAAVYDFGAGLPGVDANLLLSMIEAFPNATAEVERSDEDFNRHTILFYSGDDFGMLMPLMKGALTPERRKTEL